MSKQYTGLDIFKLFFSVCIVAVHTYAVEPLPKILSFWITQGVFRLAVPFFFVTTGFLLGKRLNEKDKGPDFVIVSYIKKLLPPLICVGAVNGLLELILQYLRRGTDFGELFFLWVQHMLFYPYGAMWYVQACIVGLLLLRSFCFKPEKGAAASLNLALFCGLPLYGWALLCNNYYFVSQALGIDKYVDLYMSIFVSARNGLFLGFLYLALGIKTYEWHLKCPSIPKLKRWLISLLICYLSEIYLLKDQDYLDDRALYLMQVMLSPIMVLCISGCSRKAEGWVFERMRKASIWIYFSHRLIYVTARIAYFLTAGKELRGPGAFLLVMALSGTVFWVSENNKRQDDAEGKRCTTERIRKDIIKRFCCHWKKIRLGNGNTEK